MARMPARGRLRAVCDLEVYSSIFEILVEVVFVDAFLGDIGDLDFYMLGTIFSAKMLLDILIYYSGVQNHY